MDADATPMNADEADMTAARCKVGDGFRERCPESSDQFLAFIGVHRRSKDFRLKER